MANEGQGKAEGGGVDYEPGAQPFAFFGHGLGAMLAYEVTRFVQRRARLAPLHLFLSGQTDPAHHEDSGAPIPHARLPLYRSRDPSPAAWPGSG